MRRDWNNPLFASERQDDESAADTLASVSEPRFLESLQRVFDALHENGEKVCISTMRHKYDADGQDVTGDDDAAGQFKTDGYSFLTASDEWAVTRKPEDEGSTPSHLCAYELARDLTPDIVRSLVALKITFDFYGGQAWISPYVQNDQILGYVFVWDHISKLGRGKEPDAKIAEPLPLKVAEAVSPNGAHG